MSQFNAPVRRSGGGLDVYTGLLLVAFLVRRSGFLARAGASQPHRHGNANDTIDDELDGPRERHPAAVNIDKLRHVG